MLEGRVWSRSNTLSERLLWVYILILINIFRRFVYLSTEYKKFINSSFVLSGSSTAIQWPVPLRITCFTFGMQRASSSDGFVTVKSNSPEHYETWTSYFSEFSYFRIGIIKKSTGELDIIIRITSRHYLFDHPPAAVGFRV